MAEYGDAERATEVEVTIADVDIMADGNGSETEPLQIPGKTDKEPHLLKVDFGKEGLEEGYKGRGEISFCYPPRCLAKGHEGPEGY